MRAWRIPVYAILLVVVPLLFAQRRPRPPLKPTEQVIKQFEKFVANGSFLSAEGWKQASTIFVGDNSYPEGAPINVVSATSAIGEQWVRGDRARVDTKWRDNCGTIDSKLQYKAPLQGESCLPMIEEFSLVLARSPSGQPEWKIENPLKVRWATPKRALEYVTMMRNRTTNPAIRRNAAKTIKILKELTSGCVNRNSAC